MDNIQEQMSNISRKIKTKGKTLKKKLEIKNTVTAMENAFDGSSVHWTQPRKELVSLTICQ